MYVLGRHQQPVPVGVAGELYIGGDGLARGYHDRPALTAERFIPNPFARQPGARLYRTGDRARYLRDGQIEFLGRNDGQVKVRGHRIELGEMEAALARHPSVGACVAVAREEAGGHTRLVAYVVTAEGGEGATGATRLGELREHLRRSLPEYMVPSAIVLLDELPLTPNGKVDRSALPAPGEVGAGDDEARPESLTPVEELLAGLWSEVLGVARVSPDDNFFEVGGHSLLATQLMSRVREAFGVEVGLRKLFEGPTVRALGRRVEELLAGDGGAPPPPVRRVAREGAVPVSFAQRRLWFLDQLEPNNPFYNNPLAVRLSGELNREALGRTLTEIVRRHEALRTTFREVAGEPVQVIAEPGPVRLPEVDLGELAEAEREAAVQRLARDEAGEAFNLSRGPLLRLKLLRLAPREHVVLLTMHHIVSDGWSMGVFVNEVAALYRAYAEGRESPLEELEVQYADFAVWQREWLRGEALERQLSYWDERLRGAAILELPTDRPRPAVPTHRGASHSFELSAELGEGLKALSRREGATLFMTLLAGFQALLARHTGQMDVVVGTVVAGRTRREVEPLVGLFINTLALRTDLSGDPTFGELLRRVREVCLGAYAHQDVPFERLVEELRPERAAGRSPLFEVTFGVQNAPAGKLEGPGLELRPVEAESGRSRFDLTVWVSEGGGRLRVGMTYNTELFEEGSVAGLRRRYETLLESAVKDPGARLSALEFIPQEEKERLFIKEQQHFESNVGMLRSIKRVPVRANGEVMSEGN